MEPLLSGVVTALVDVVVFGPVVIVGYVLCRIVGLRTLVPRRSSDPFPMPGRFADQLARCPVQAPPSPHR